MLDVNRNRLTSELSRGFYGGSEAVRLVNFRRDKQDPRKLGRSTIRRWVEGYKSGGTAFSPLWRSDYVNADGTLELSFRDVIELRFVKAFRDAGVSLQTIRSCFVQAKEIVEDDRPFSTLKFQTDGKTIFQSITKSVTEGEMTDLRTRQNVFRNMIEPSLKDLEFDGGELKRWRPLGSRSAVAVDPTIAFGRPIVLGYSITTEALATALPIEGSLANVARLYDVPISAVRNAVFFHERLAA
jgi:uncharacterized protein (DUF433 family)